MVLVGGSTQDSGGLVLGVCVSRWEPRESPNESNRYWLVFATKCCLTKKRISSVVLNITYSNKSVDWLGLPWQLCFTVCLLGGVTLLHMCSFWAPTEGMVATQGKGFLGFGRSARQHGLLRLRLGLANSL